MKNWVDEYGLDPKQYKTQGEYLTAKVKAAQADMIPLTKEEIDVIHSRTRTSGGGSVTYDEYRKQFNTGAFLWNETWASYVGRRFV